MWLNNSIANPTFGTPQLSVWGLYPLNTWDYNPHNMSSQAEEVPVIKFDKLWAVMEQKGVTTYALREKGGIDSKTIRRLRNNENMETKTLDKLCKA